VCFALCGRLVAVVVCGGFVGFLGKFVVFAVLYLWVIL